MSCAMHEEEKELGKLKPQAAKLFGETVVDLSHRNYGIRGISILAGHLASNDLKLQTVKLGFNQLGDSGSIIVADYIRINNSITCLDLGFNAITDKGAGAIAQSLSVNTTLTSLYLSGNKISGDGFSYFEHLFKVNSTLKSLHLTSNAGKAEVL